MGVRTVAAITSGLRDSLECVPGVAVWGFVLRLHPEVVSLAAGHVCVRVHKEKPTSSPSRYTGFTPLSHV